MSNVPPTPNISYTQFKKQLADGNVHDVTVKGDQITGTLKKKQQLEEQKTERKHFKTTLPPFDDPDLLHTLEQKSVTLTAKTEGTPWLGMLLINLLPWILILGFIVYSSRKMQERMGGPGGLLGFGKSKAQRYQRTKSETRFSDVAGLDNAKRDLQEIIDYLRDPTQFTALGAKLPKGVLLIGPPGTGKTLLARACAGEAGVPFFSISGSEFIEMFVGVGASRVRDMFENAKKEAPAIIFIDEIDSIGRARGTGLGGGHDEREQTLNQILAEMDGFSPHESVVVMAATNRPDVLDAALTRPGRFDRQITLELPHRTAREKILRIHTRETPLANDVDLEMLARRTIGFSGAKLQNLVNEATLLAGRKQKHQVDEDDFEQARDKVLLGSEREETITDEEKQIVSYHEAGHALLAKLLPGADPLRKVTITPRGHALGATEQMPAEDRHNLSQTYLLNRIAVMLGGRVAEKLMCNERTSGAANDLKQATQLARRMVCQWGMSEKLGPVTFRQGEEHPFLGRELTETKDFSEQTAREIDEEIRNLVQKMEKCAADTLEHHQDALERLASALLEHETLDDQDVDALLRESEKEDTQPANVVIHPAAQPKEQRLQKSVSAKNTNKILSLAVALLLGSVSLVFGQSGETSNILGGYRGLTEIRGEILCSPCTIEEAKQRTGKELDLYLLDRGKQLAVMHVSEVRNTATDRKSVVGGRWDTIVGVTNELYVRANDKLWRQLTAESNLRKTLTIKGILHNTQTFDITAVSIEG